MKPEKALGRLKLVEEMMRENGQDYHITSRGDVVNSAVMYESDDWASMLEELQAVIAEIEKGEAALPPYICASCREEAE